MCLGTRTCTSSSPSPTAAASSGPRRSPPPSRFLRAPSAPCDHHLSTQCERRRPAGRSPGWGASQRAAERATVPYLGIRDRLGGQRDERRLAARPARAAAPWSWVAIAPITTASPSSRMSAPGRRSDRGRRSPRGPPSAAAAPGSRLCPPPSTFTSLPSPAAVAPAAASASSTDVGAWVVERRGDHWTSSSCGLFGSIEPRPAPGEWVSTGVSWVARPCAAWIARHTRCGVHGISTSVHAEVAQRRRGRR